MGQIPKWKPGDLVWVPAKVTAAGNGGAGVVVQKTSVRHHHEGFEFDFDERLLRRR